MTNNYCIYMHKNKVNGKVYIGQTNQKPEYRWGDNGKRYENCPHFFHAINKYGWDQFEHIILETNLTLNQANEREAYWIKHYNSTNKEKGYNIQAGGLNRNVSNDTRQKLSEHAKALWQEDSHREKMSQLMKNKWQDPEYIEKQRVARETRHWEMSEEGRKSISETRKAYITKHGTPTQGKGHSEEAKEKIRQAKLGEKNPMYGKTTSDYQKQRAKECQSKKIQCVETGEIFSSRKEAAAWAGLKTSTGILDYLAGRKKSAGKHPITGEKLHWKNID